MASGPASLSPATGATLDRVGLLWLITVRWTTLVASVGAVVAGKSGLDAGVPVGAASAVLAVFAASNLWLTWRVRRGRVGATAMVAGLLVCADVVLLSWLLLRSGGVLNPASVFYLVQIVVAALVLGPSWTWIVTGLSIGGYAALFLGQSSELQVAQGMHPEIALHMRGMWLAFAGTALIIGILVTRLAVAIERRDLALETLRERSAKASRLAGLATVVAGAAHELSTPLATMAVTARELELAVAAIPDHQELAEDARLIRHEIDRSRRVLDEMAGQIAEPMGEAPRAVKLADAVADVLGRLTPGERARVTLRVADTAVVWPVGVVSQAVLNLLRNALQASDPPTPVEVVTSLVGQDRVSLAIVDRGRGMTPDELSRAGEPFFTTKPLGVGTGLGLFVARSAIERVGGTLELSSMPGRGTTATVTLTKDTRKV